MNLLDRLPPGSRIVLIRLRSLGDCVLTTPAIALLKSHRPDLRISVIVEPRFAPVFEGNPAVDETREALTKGALIVNLHGGTRSLLMTAMARANYKAGFGHHRYSFLYSHRIPRAQEILGEERPVHTAEHLASAMFWLGVPRQEIPRASLYADAVEQRAPYAVIHPFASAAEKTWPAERFLQVARSLPVEPVFLAGPADDTSPFKEFRTFRESLASTKNLMAGASLFIGNDSGPAHIAAAFGVPVVVLFGPSNPVTWAPWKTEARVLTAPRMSGIEVREVLEAAETLKVRV